MVWKGSRSERQRFTSANQNHSPAAPIRKRDLSPHLTGQRPILTHFVASRLDTHTSRNITSNAVFFQYNISSPLLCLCTIRRFVVNPKREWHNGQRQIIGTQTCIQKIQPLTCCCVRRACFSVTRRKVLEFAFGRLGVTTAHASWLALLDCRVLISAGGT